jgi:hypothetical protein
VGAARAYIESEDGRQASDPANAAAAIAAALDAEEPPLRLALGGAVGRSGPNTPRWAPSRTGKRRSRAPPRFDA